MPLQFHSEQEPTQVRLPVEQQERELAHDGPSTLSSSSGFDLVAGLGVGAVPLTLLAIGAFQGAQSNLPWLLSSALALLVLCLLYFLALRPYRSVRRGLMVGMSLLTGLAGLQCMVLSAAGFFPRLNHILESGGQSFVYGSNVVEDVLTGAIGLALLGLAAAIVRTGLRREKGPTP